MTVEIHWSLDTNEFHKAAEQEERKIRQAGRQASRKLGQRALQLFRGTVRTWVNKPEFEMIFNEAGDLIELLIGTDDKIYGFIDKGTSVRYALMSPDFAPKSSPGSLQATGGRGGVIFVSRSNPRPGIRARNFSKRIEEIISREAEPTFNRELSRIR